MDPTNDSHEGVIGGALVGRIHTAIRHTERTATPQTQRGSNCNKRVTAAPNLSGAARQKPGCLQARAGASTRARRFPRKRRRARRVVDRDGRRHIVSHRRHSARTPPPGVPPGREGHKRGVVVAFAAVFAQSFVRERECCFVVPVVFLCWTRLERRRRRRRFWRRRRNKLFPFCQKSVSTVWSNVEAGFGKRGDVPFSPPKLTSWQRPSRGH